MNKEPLSLREIQNEEFKILVKVVETLMKNNLSYLLCGGTMLGAVRHNGFIPWDDDIDILVPRDDYEKLKNLVICEHLNTDDLHYSIPGEKDYPYPFIKVVNRKLIVVDTRIKKSIPQYLWIDIFPLDHFPDDVATHKKVVKSLMNYQHFLYAGMMTSDYWKQRGFTTLKKRVMLMMAQLAYIILGGADKIGKRVDKLAFRINNKYRESDHFGDGAWPNGMKDYFETKDVRPLIKHQFETAEFNIPANYDSYLTKFYGDYMKIPPVEERQDHHIEVYRL